MSTVDHIAVRDYLRRTRARVTASWSAGTPEWCALDDTDPAKLDAVLIAGAQRVLELELAAIDARRYAHVQAAKEVAAAKDWAAVARTLRDRDESRRSGAYIGRVVA